MCARDLVAIDFYSDRLFYKISKYHRFDSWKSSFGVVGIDRDDL